MACLCLRPLLDADVGAGFCPPQSGIALNFLIMASIPFKSRPVIDCVISLGGGLDEVGPVMSWGGGRFCHHSCVVKEF